MKRFATLLALVACLTAIPASPATWTPQGPAPLPNGQVRGGGAIPVSGRVTAIAVHPTNPNTVYIGAAQGGVYRTLDGGSTWVALMDTSATLAIGAVTIDPVDPTKVFVGTGEGNLCGDCFAGLGLYRIDNADTSPIVNGPFETRVSGTGTTAGSTHAFLGSSITRIVVDPTNDNRVFVGNTRGIGGIGRSLPPFPSFGLYFSQNALSPTPTFSLVNMPLVDINFDAITDIVFEPGSTSNLIIGLQDLNGGADSGVYRTTNANVAPSSAPTFSRTLAFASRTNIRLAINKVNSTVTVLAATEESNGTLRRSIDGGATWSPAITAATGFCDGQCFYDMSPALDPANANNIYLGGSAESGSAHIFRFSTDGGVTFTTSSTHLHADVHAVVPAPSLPSTIFLGTDGGIFKSTDSGFTWTSLNNSGLNTLQFNSVALHPTDAKFSLGGDAGNGTVLRDGSGAWNRVDGGTGGYAAIDQNATDTSTVRMYHTYFNATNIQIGFAVVSNVASAHDGGWSFLGCGGISNGISCADSVLFYPPLVLGPGSPNTVYFGTDKLYRSVNGGVTMTAVSQTLPSPISSIAISPNESVRVVGLSNGQVWATTVGSSVFSNVTPSGNTTYVGRIVVDGTNADIAYVALAGFVAAGGNILKTTNLSNINLTWSNSGSGIPAVPVNSLVIDPNNHSNIFAGTDVGVYASTDGGSTWAPFGTGLPIVPIFDMGIQNSARILRVATHGRGMWEISIAPIAPTVVSYQALFGSQSFTVPGGRTKLPWTAITGIKVTFSKPVTGNSSSLTGVSVIGFSGSGTDTLTWTFSPLVLAAYNTKVLGTTANAVLDLTGAPLGGGVDFAQTLNVLPGDVSDDGNVASNDLVLVNNARSAAYNVIDDINGDGVVDINDVNLVRARIGTHLP